MCYVKKYDVGQIKVDLPYANYIHELPLLSIGDVKHNINLSLVFNYNRYKEESENGSNPFFIAPGYKLNLQKRLTSDEQGDPEKIQEANGEFIDLNKIYPHTFTFDDESQRILRSTEQHTLVPVPGGNVEYGTIPYDHNVEYPDFSRERYNEAGRITNVYNKYNKNILSYAYSEYGQLISICYNNSKTIYFEYDSNRLKSITYGNCETIFNYNDGMLTSIEHYGGDVYEFTLSGMNYAVKSKENATTVVYSKELSLSDDKKIIQITDKIEDNITKTVSYRYPYDLSYEMCPYSYVDTIDNNGVETRTQFLDGKAICSYEVKEGQVLFGGEHCQSKVLSNVTFYKAARTYDNFEATGVQTRSDGNVMNIPDSFNSWSFEPSQNGYYTLSGWIKPKGSESLYQNINIGKHPHIMEEYDIGKLYADQWKYFSIMFYSSGTVYVNGSTNNVYLRDLRLTFQGTANSMSEYMLFNGNNKIPFKDIKFYYTNAWGETVELSNVMLSDVLRYKLRKKKYGLYNEYYSENCANVLKDATNLRINYNGSEIAVGDLDLGFRVYSKGKEFLTRFNVDEDNQSTNIVKIQFVNNTEVGREILNNNLDIIEATSEGITVYNEYASSNCGLITKQTSAPVGVSKDSTSRTDVIVKQYNYDEGLTKIESVVDEFGETTYYTTDDVWGVVTAVTLPDNTVITDIFDNDRCALLSRRFSNVSNARKTEFTYSDANLASLVHGDLWDDIAFGFEYTNEGELQSVYKNNTSIEHHTITRNTSEGITTIESKYPSEGSALNTITKTFDKYGRLAKINGQLENVYDFYPSYIPTDNCPMQYPNSCAVLEKTTDLKTGEVHEYGYDNKYNISQKQTKNSSGTVISTETFGYDDSNRLTSDNCTYDTNSSKSVGSAIEYVSSSDDRINSYSYKVNGTEKAKTENSFDAYKRLSEKTYTVGGKVFVDEIEYNKTRAAKVTNSSGGTNTYQYDDMGRISAINDVEYIYDEYGQLMEEKTLDKTIQYAYNGIGNIESVTYYSGNSSTPYKTETYGYSGDRLTSYNGESISYNSNGCPTTYNGYATTWQNGKLTRFRMGMKLSGMHDYTYSYNGLGQRIKRSYKYTEGSLVGGSNDVYWGMPTGSDITMSYDHSGRLISESIEKTYYGENGSRNEDVVYLYDENSVIGMVYTNSDGTNTYYFQRNLLGDIIGIYDTNGNKVGGYAYDAWGNCEFASDTTNYDVVYANSFRYRGYYYDTDTKLYYLNARYYSPEWRRFISPDDTAYLDPENVNGLNLYCYCNNDPINYADPSGRFAISLAAIGLIVGAALFATAGGIAAYNIAKDNGAEGWDLFGWTALGVVSGGVIGAALGYGVGALIAKLTGVLGFSVTRYSIIPVNNTTILGHFTTYRKIAQRVNAGTYHIPNRWYKHLQSIGKEWINNLQYLIDANSLGTQFVITPEHVVLENGTLWKEIQYLITNNIPWILQ